jgi:hypothetical protein
MTEALMNRIKAQLVRHNGLKLKPYRCIAGYVIAEVKTQYSICGTFQTETELPISNYEL